MGLVGLLLIGAVLGFGSGYALWLCWTVVQEVRSRIRQAKEAGAVVPRSLWIHQALTVLSAGVFLVVAGSIASSAVRNAAFTHTVGGIKIVADNDAEVRGIPWGEPGNRGMLHVLSSPDGPQVTGASLCYIRFDNDDLKQLLEQYPRIEWFVLSGTQINDRAIELLSKRKSLVALTLTDTSISDLGLAWLKGHPGLEKLDLGDTAITDESLAVMASLPKLRYLNLSETAVTEKGLEFLRGNTTLRTLRLEGTGISDEAVALVASFKRLEKLYILGSEFSRAGLVRLQASLPGCKIVQENIEVPRIHSPGACGAELSVASSQATQ